MSFTYQKTDFINLKTYNEQTHADALKNGIPNFINDGFDYNKTTNILTSGKGINNGVPFVVGKAGETQTVTSNYTGYLYVETTLSGFGSVSKVLQGTSIPADTATKRHFKLYQLNGGNVVQDNRHVEYIKYIAIEPIGDDKFAININGTLSNEFSTSTLQDAYTKSDADKHFVYKMNFAEFTSDSQFTGKNAGACAWLMVKSLLDQEVQYGNYVIMEGYRTIERATSPILHGIFSDLVGEDTYDRIFIYYKPRTAAGLASLADFTLSFEGDVTREWQYVFNNFVGTGDTEPTKTSDALRLKNFFSNEIYSNGVPVTGERHRSFVGFNGLSALYNNSSIMLNLQGYSMAQVQKITFVFSNYITGSGDTVNQNIEEKQITNFISGGANDGYDGFYDTHVFSVPFSAFLANIDDTVPSYLKAYNVESTGKVTGLSDLIIYSSGGVDYGYGLRTAYITIADNHWTKPANATLKNSERDINLFNKKSFEEQCEREKEFVKNGLVIDVEEWQEEKKQQMLQYEETHKIEIKLSELETAQMRMEEQLQEMKKLKEEIEALREENNE